MHARLDFWKAAPALLKSVTTLNAAVDGSGLEKRLTHLVKLRASQINGCSFCVDMHSHEARRDGDTEQRVYLVSAWRESSAFTERERAAFAWTEALTRLQDGPVEDALYAETLRHFSPEELVKLSVLVGMINMWNRLAVPFRSPHPVRHEADAA